MTEDQFQAHCWQWVWNTHPETRRCFWAVPNGGARLVKEALKFQATGVLPGVHDLHLLWDWQFYTFELKVGNNTLSDPQIKFAASITTQGGKWFEVRWMAKGDEEKFKRLFEDVLLGKYKRIR